VLGSENYIVESSPYPRLEVRQNLPKQTNENISSVPLHAYGYPHAINVDGTPDGKIVG